MYIELFPIVFYPPPRVLIGQSHSLQLSFSPLPLSPRQLRCEQILRSKPESRLASELHLASIESTEQSDRKKVKDAAIGGATAMAAVGIAAGIASFVLSKK